MGDPGIASRDRHRGRSAVSGREGKHVRLSDRIDMILVVGDNPWRPGNVPEGPGMTIQILTVGHSNRTLEDFLALLQAHGVEKVIDVRRFPSSRRHPHFNGPALAAALAAVGIGYQHIPELGGRRRPRPGSIHTGWRTAGFQGYADYMETPAFQAALEAVIADAAQARVALMCAEALPWRCHRRLIADALLVRGIQVEHIRDPYSRELHRLTPWARVEGTQLIYAGPATLWGTSPERLG